MQTGLRFMHNANWDDLRFVLAVADNGSVSGASRELGVNHATVLRRVAAFEEAHGAEVFERTAAGYRVRPDRARMIEAARNAAQAVAAVGQLMKWAEGPRDVVRLTSTDTLCNTVLADLPRTMPRHEVSLLAANGHLDLSRLEADVTVRPATALPAGMSGRAVAELGFATYRARWGGRNLRIGCSATLIPQRFPVGPTASWFCARWHHGGPAAPFFPASLAIRMPGWSDMAVPIPATGCRFGLAAIRIWPTVRGWRPSSTIFAA